MTSNISPAGRLFAAIERGDEAQVVDLLELSPDLVWAADTQRKTGLHVAAEHDRAGIAAMLIDQGADVNATMAAGMTPLQLAQSKGSAKVAKLLAERTART